MSRYNFSHKFLDPEKVLFRAGLTVGQTLADLGAGSGHYSLSAGRAVGTQGKVYVVDLLEPSLAHVAADAKLRMLKNIETIRADLEQTNSVPQIPSGSCDMVVFGNLLHQIKNRGHLLQEAYRILKTGGKILLIDWNDTPGPIGPKHHERLPIEKAKKEIAAAGFKSATEIETDAYHYGLTFVK